MQTATETPAQPAAEAPPGAARVASYARNLPPRGRTGWRRWLIAIVILSVLLFAVSAALSALGVYETWFGGGTLDAAFYVVEPVNLSITLTEDGELKPKNSVEIKCEVEGQNTIRTVVEESTQVKKGDLLVELASEKIQDRIEQEATQERKLTAALTAAREGLDITKSENASKIEKAKIDLHVAELNLEKYIKGDYEKAKQTIEINIEQTKRDIERKKEELAKNVPLEEKGFVAKSKIRDLKFELARAEMTLQQHELSMLILETYDKPKALAQNQSTVDRAREELDRVQKRATSREAQGAEDVKAQAELLAMCQKRLGRLQDQLEKCRIVAPIDGMVQYPSDGWGWRGDNQIAPGERVFEGQTLMTLPDTSQMVVTARIHEADRHRVHEDMNCLVTVPAVPGEVFTGKITRIAQFADSANRWLNPELKEHTTEILLDETDAPLSPGDSAEIKILIGDLPEVLAVPVQCVFSRGSQSYVFVQNGGSAEHTEVTLGKSNTTMVEVCRGLSPGDQVCMQVGEELLATLPAPDAEDTQLKELLDSTAGRQGRVANAHGDTPKPLAAEAGEPQVVIRAADTQVVTASDDGADEAEADEKTEAAAEEQPTAASGTGR